MIVVILTWHDPGPVGCSQTGAVRHLRRRGVGRHDADLLEVGRLTMVQQSRAASGRGGLRVRRLPPACNALHQSHVGKRWRRQQCWWRARRPPMLGDGDGGGTCG